VAPEGNLEEVVVPDSETSVEHAIRTDKLGGRTGAGSSSVGRKIVIFADGTGNAFSTQESNVWRLYEALDRTKPDQVAYYIKGVGTAGWRPLAALDGATGIGVPSNVRKLYRFLCWNWRPGDDIYIFGFSRGSFTARTLAALIASEGLVPATIDDVPVSHAEMQRNAMAAWRNYRRRSVPWHKSLPTIWIARLVRDAVLSVYHRILRHRSYADVRKKMDSDRRDVRIKFLGIFDTVEAFGVPIEELRTAIDWAIWPISFRNGVLSQKVDCARHALSLDDERTAFHPLRFDRSKETNPERIKEVWFAGVHSDVGGGYPDGTLSFVPLVWMAEQVEKELRFQPGQIDHFRAYQSAIGPLHDSRSGTAVLYRYGPRPIGEDKADGGPPIVDHSVVERMQRGCDNYAPVTLPASAQVLMPGGTAVAMTDKPARAALNRTPSPSANKVQLEHEAAAVAAVTTMQAPDKDMVEQTLDTVWWRRFAYFSLLWMLAALVAWPFAAAPVVTVLSKLAAILSLGSTQALAGLALVQKATDGVSAVIGSTVTYLGNFLPSYLHPWVTAAQAHPISTAAVAVLAFATWRMGFFLRDRIQERARLAWDRPGRNVVVPRVPSRLLAVARVMRTSSASQWVYTAATKILFPGVFLIALFGLALIVLGRSDFNWRAGTGDICKDQHHPTTVVSEQPTEAGSPFETSSPCWASGLKVEKDHKYRIWISVVEPWFDRTIMSGANGFQLYDPKHVVALPIRRWYAADWFQPVVRIGSQGTAELPLTAANAMPADQLPRKGPDGKDLPIHVEDADAGSNLPPDWQKKFGNFEPIPKDALPASREIWQRQGLAKLMVADFIAPESGELFLYVNDAIQIFPFFGPFELYYRNNSGSAKVEVQRLPLPPLPGK
jgi:uncharacterized protein (DUF2235 family)